jgi:tetratricopeptide (TPR) repeat protein/transcriptional regulator with XRE-family HTH domain
MAMRNDIHGSFGSLLHVFRRRRHLTQKQLAAAVGVHRNAIGRWEQGDFLPATKGIVLELARHLTLDESETRQLLEASLTALSPHWLVPFPRNPFFTGREEILEALHSQLGDQQVMALTQSLALSGLGGVGKTQIALEYTYRHGLEYAAVFWIAAETEELVVASLLHIAEVLQLPGHDDKNQQRVVEMVQRWLATHQQWLLIWDNVEDLSLLERLLPASRSGAILLTTRRQTLGVLALGMDLLPMEPREGLRLLLRRAKMLGAEATEEQVQHFAQQMPLQYEAAVEVVETLAGLPLAIDQAGAYLEETRCGLLAYRDLFRAQRATLLQQRGEGSGHHPASVFTTFTLALTATTRNHPAVGDLLRVCALLQPDAIPEELFLQGGVHLGPVLQAACADPLEWNRVVAVACSYSLLHRQPEAQTFSLHRLVQAVLLDSLPSAERRLWVWRTIEALDATFPDMTYATWKQGERLLPHVLLCLQHLEVEKQARVCASVAFKAGQYMSVHGRYMEGEPLYRRALLIQEQTQGPDSLDVAATVDHLALLYWRQGKSVEAEALLQRALRIWEQVLGPHHPEVAFPLNHLANIYKEQGNYVKAELFHCRALSIREQALGSQHYQVAVTLNNLGILYRVQGKYAEAEALFLRALPIQEQARGAEYPETANVLNNLANLYSEQGKYTEAEPLLLRALHTWEQALGPEHPETARVLNNLAELYYRRGKYEQAEPMYLRALHIWEQQLGAEHPHTATSLNNLAELYYQQGKYEQAEPMYHQAIATKEKLLGVEHLDTAYALQGLALLHRDRGNEDAEAERLFVRILAIRERQLVATHPDLAETWHEFAIFRQQQGRWDEALSFYRRALAARSHTLGPSHAATLDTHKRLIALFQDLARVRQQQGKRDEALAFAEEALQMCSYLSGEAHPLAVVTRTLHAQLLQEESEPQNTAISEAELVAIPVARIKDCSGESASLAASIQPLQEFLDACCELHPRARCRSADLWQAYVHWAEEHERFPLSRRALTTQLKAVGCQTNRTSTARIWCGITIISETGHQKMTEDDRR